MQNSVKFDPGIGSLVIDLYDFVNYFYSQLSMINSKYQKNTFFHTNSLKIKKYIKNNISFYLGCLLWAYYIYNENIQNPKEIIGNDFLSLSQEELQEYDFLNQVNFLNEFFVIFEKDVLKYTGKKFQIPESWKKILDLYSEFLKLNNGFVTTKTTSDIKLPIEFSKLSFNFDINEKIQNAINEKNLDLLLELEIFS